MRPLEQVVGREDARNDDGGQVEASSECQALEYVVLGRVVSPPTRSATVVDDFILRRRSFIYPPSFFAACNLLRISQFLVHDCTTYLARLPLRLSPFMIITE